MASRPRPPVTDLWLALDTSVELCGIIIDYGRRNYRYKHEWSLMRDRVRTRGAWTVTSAMNAPKPRKQRIKPFTYAATGLAGIGLAVSVGACGSTTTVTRTVPGPTVTATGQGDQVGLLVRQRQPGNSGVQRACQRRLHRCVDLLRQRRGWRFRW